MSGLVKPKQYDWKDSNLAMFGSEDEKQVSYRSNKVLNVWNERNPQYITDNIYNVDFCFI